MAIRAMTTHDTIKYVSDRDPCKVKSLVPVDPRNPDGAQKSAVTIEEGATYFHLGPLDVFLMGVIYDNSQRMSGSPGDNSVQIETRINQTNLEAVRYGLRGFENFTGPDGTQARFTTEKHVVGGREYQRVSYDTMNLLDLSLVQELAGEIKRLSEVQPEEAKKSVGA